MLINRKTRRQIAAVAGLTLASAPALALPARPALILPPALSAKAEMAGHRLGIGDYELAMLMLAKAAPGLFGGGVVAGGGANIADLFDIQIGTASALDALSTTGWDLLIGKSRVNATDWSWRNSAHGLSNNLKSNSTAASGSFSDYATLLGSGDAVLTRMKKAPGLLDIQFYAGNGTSGRKIPHNLASVPGMYAIKRLTGTEAWYVYHRSLGNFLQVTMNNASAAVDNGSIIFNNEPPTSSDITVGNYEGVNRSGDNYVAFIYGHNTAADGLIQCGSYNGNGSTTGPVITLGWMPQFVEIKRSDTSGDWRYYDSTRSPSNPRILKVLPNSSAAEDTAGEDVDFTSTGFQPKDNASGINASGGTYLYRAIRAP